MTAYGSDLPIISVFIRLFACFRLTCTFPSGMSPWLPPNRLLELPLFLRGATPSFAPSAPLLASEPFLLPSRPESPEPFLLPYLPLSSESRLEAESSVFVLLSPRPCPDILLSKSSSSSGWKLVLTSTSPDFVPFSGTHVPEFGPVTAATRRSSTGILALPNGLSFPILSLSNTPS